MDGAEELAVVRRELLEEFALLPDVGDVVAWQRRLADAIIAAEASVAGVDAVVLRRHRHLLRVIGDALVHALLPSHTIRALSRHPGKPAALSAQGADFGFVFEVAERVRATGAVPIVADLTTLVGIGDVVAWRGDQIEVLECKNRVRPDRVSTSGRVARQRERGRRTAQYLTGSRVEEAAGAVREAYTLDLPEPDWNSVGDVVERCAASADGMAACSFGADDTLVAFRHDAVLSELPSYLPSGEGLAVPAMATYSSLFDQADHRVWAPSSYPLPGARRAQLLEGELRLVRMVDLGGLAADFTEAGRRVRLLPRAGANGYEVGVEVAGFDPVVFTRELVELCLWMPVPVAALHATLVTYARQLVAGAGDGTDLGSATALADGDAFVYGTAYTDGVQW